MSRGFLSALAGVALTLLAWFGHWTWPGWPAIAAVDLAFGHAGFDELAYGVRAAIVVALIAVNVAAWALLLRGLIAGAEWLTRSRRSAAPKP